MDRRTFIARAAAGIAVASSVAALAPRDFETSYMTYRYREFAGTFSNRLWPQMDLTEDSLTEVITQLRAIMMSRDAAIRIQPRSVVNAEHIRLVMYGDPWA